MTNLVLLDIEARQLDLMERKANYIAKVPGLRKEIQNNAAAVTGLMVALAGYGIEPTIYAINNCFDWINGEAVMSTQFTTALARKAGWSILPVERTDRTATARAEHLHEQPVEVSFSLDDAIAAHRLDEWVERWVKEDRGWRKTGTFVVAVDGEATEKPWPDWAEKQFAERGTKRYDAWWNWRADMLWKSAARRAVRLACPHVLLGITDDSDDVVLTPTGPAMRGAPSPVGEPDDIDDAEVVEPDDRDDPERPF